MKNKTIKKSVQLNGKADPGTATIDYLIYQPKEGDGIYQLSISDCTRKICIDRSRYFSKQEIVEVVNKVWTAINYFHENMGVGKPFISRVMLEDRPLSMDIICIYDDDPFGTIAIGLGRKKVVIHRLEGQSFHLWKKKVKKMVDAIGKFIDVISLPEK